jgi:hypothetical protein
VGDLALIVVAFIPYYLVRGMVVERAEEATDRAIRLVELEQRLGIYGKSQTQGWILSNDFLIDLFNGIYVHAHFPLMAAIGIWLFFFRRPRYLLFRNAFLISGAIGMVIFNLFPWPRRACYHCPTAW